MLCVHVTCAMRYVIPSVKHALSVQLPGWLLALLKASLELAFLSRTPLLRLS